MKTVADIPELSGKRVLLRVDFDVPVGADGKIQESFRIQKQKENLDYLRQRGAQVTLISHITAVPSFAPLMPQLQEILGPIDLRENLRAHTGEEANDPAFARELAEGFDLYVNNAFAVCHREHASVSAVTKLLPAYAGLLVQAETEQLAKVITAPAEGKMVIMAGAKAATKIPVIKNFLDKAQMIFIGGILANDILAGQTEYDAHDPRFHLPTDFIMDEGVARDIGPQSVQAFAALVEGAKLIVWNGPLGKFEDERFMAGTRAVTEAIVASGAFTVIGGGDTVSAVDKLGFLDRIGFVSTGGGAMLAFLAGTELPGLKALGY